MRGAFRANLFLLLLVALSICFSAAKCYPPGTRVVVFLQGVYMEYDPEWEGTRKEPFREMKLALVAAGYDDAVLLDFSYRGGVVTEDGVWQPNAYGCGDSDRRADENASKVDAMLRAYREKHPQAHFTLIGHSLGGYVAYRAGVRDAQRPPEERLEIDAVVTLDSPLKGISADKKFALDAINCDKTFLAGGELVEEKADPGLLDKRRAEIDQLRAAGIRLATIGNEGDCLYNLPRCTDSDDFVDDTDTQYLEGADMQLQIDTTGSVFATHFIVMKVKPVLDAVVACAGPP